MMAADTYSLYRKLAEERPLKASRYRASIRDTLERTTIHELERARLEEALRGIADGLAPTCGKCHRPLSDPESIELGYGPDCAAQLSAVAS